MPFIIGLLLALGVGFFIRWLIKRNKSSAKQTAVNTPPQNNTPASSTPADQVSFCPNCGTKIESGSAFCGNCGHKVG